MRSTATNKLPRNPFTILSRVFSRASPMEVLHEKTLHASGGAVRFCGDKFSNRQLKEHFKSQCGQFLPRLYRPVSLVIIKPVEPSIDKNSQVPLGNKVQCIGPSIGWQFEIARICSSHFSTSLSSPVKTRLSQKGLACL